MTRKIPPDAFDFYFGLGPGRSYQAVAEHFKVNKRSITSLAVRDGWQQKLVSIERQARERSDTKMVETIEAMQTKHLKSLQFVLGRALETLRAQPLATAMEAVRAIEMVVKQERAVRGEPKDQDALSVETIIKREYALLMVAEEEERDGDAAASGGEEEPE